MDRSTIVEPTPLCQEALWRTIQRIGTAAQHVGDPQFPAAVTLIVMGNSAVIRDADEGVVELWKGRAVVLTRPCILVVTKEELELHQCTAGRYRRGRWIRIDKCIAPSGKEYYEASELYDKLAHIFKRVADHISNILSS